MSRKPNIILIFSDQQHYRAIGKVNPWFNTPNIDRFMSNATHFTHAFCTTPQCSPSRSSLLTGYYPHRTGVMGNIGNLGGKDLSISTIGKKLRDNGYDTAYIGKWHLGRDPRGYDGWNYQYCTRKDKLATKKAIKYIKKKASEKSTIPFFLVVSLVNPHDICSYSSYKPNRKEKKEIEKTPIPESAKSHKFDTKPIPQKMFLTEDRKVSTENPTDLKWKEYRYWYKKCVANFDENFGKIMDAIQKSNLIKDSVIILTSDHGDMDLHNALILKGPFMYDNILRIPLMIYIPERFGGMNRPGAPDVLTINTDIVPTILDFAQISYNASEYPNAKSLMPLLVNNRRNKGDNISKEPNIGKFREYIIAEYYGKQKWVNPIRTIRTHRWKYNEYLKNGEELYDLANDPDELINLANNPEYTEIKKDLKARLHRWIEDNGDPFFSLHRTDLSGNIIE